MNREKLRGYLDIAGKKGPLLEIGPFINPFVSKETYDVYYADIHSKEDIFNRYCSNGSLYSRLNLNSPEELYSKIMPIDYVVSESYHKTVGNMRFSGIFSSHVIEHTLDIIRHLTELYECLSEDGILVMAIPDKRYCMDHFREVTPFRDALDVYLNGADSLARLVFDDVFSSSPCNTPNLYHSNSVSGMIVATDLGRYIPAYKKYRDIKENPNWVNAHVWVFTYCSFLAFLRDGLKSGLLSYVLEYSAAPQNGSNEFHIVLKKDKAVRSDNGRRITEIIKIQALLDELDGVQQSYAADLKEYCEKSDKIYIYGAGGIGVAVYHLLESLSVPISGFIVSDGQPKEETLLNLPVHYISDNFEQKDRCGIILALHVKNEVIPILKKLDLKYFEIT